VSHFLLEAVLDFWILTYTFIVWLGDYWTSDL